ncbi:hypothetical protein HDU67_006777 [Dinochytrium kinnereticum]|nr:hypothetical protein HDU67_006777 [Dinochytrium kinnereticum]
MGCSASVPQSSEVAESKLIKRRAIKAIHNGERWRSSFAEFLDALEKSGFIGALWAEDEHDAHFADVFKKFSLHLTELSVIARVFLTSLDDHLILLSDLFALQREHHDSIKKCAEAHSILLAVRQKTGRRATRINETPSGSSNLSTSSRARRHSGAFMTLFAAKRRESIVTPEDDSAESLEAHLDVRAEARAHLDVKESIKVVTSRRDRLDRAKAARLPLSLADVLNSYGTMWTKAADVFARMRAAGVDAGWIVGDISSVQIDQQERSDGGGGGGFGSTDMDVSTSKRRLKLLRRWCVIADRAVVLWQEMKDLERAHVKTCLEWLKDNKTFFVTIEDQTSRQRQNIERPLYLTILESWLSILQYHSSHPDTIGSTQLKGPTLAAYDALVNFTKTLFQVRYREEDAIKKIKNIAVASSKSKYTHRKGLSKRTAPLQSNGEEIPLKKHASKTMKLAHQLETDRYRLNRLLSDNRAFRKSGLARVQMEMWTNLKGCLCEIGGNYHSVTSSFQKILPSTPGAHQWPPSYEGLIPTVDPRLALDQSPITFIVSQVPLTKSLELAVTHPNLLPDVNRFKAQQEEVIITPSSPIHKVVRSWPN